MFERSKMTNRFEIDGLAVRQVRHRFANIYYMTLDTRPSLISFLQVEKAERGLGMRLALISTLYTCIHDSIHIKEIPVYSG